MSKNHQKPNARGFVDRFYNTILNQTPEQSSNLISNRDKQINQTPDSSKKVLKKRKLKLNPDFVNDRPTPGFITNKINPT